MAAHGAGISVDRVVAAMAGQAALPRKNGELGLDVPSSRELRVWDSSAEMRYMVLPQRPAGTERLGETDLVPLVTRDALIGVAEVAPPAS